MGEQAKGENECTLKTGLVESVENQQDLILSNDVYISYQMRCYSFSTMMLFGWQPPTINKTQRSMLILSYKDNSSCSATLHSPPLLMVSTLTAVLCHGTSL